MTVSYMWRYPVGEIPVSIIDKGVNNGEDDATEVTPLEQGHQLWRRDAVSEFRSDAGKYRVALKRVRLR